MKEVRPNSRDIARLAQVSQATVSRALRDSPLVTPETRARVRSVAEQLRYRADRSAAGLRSRSSQTLALLLFEETPDDAEINPFFLSMLGHITRAAARRSRDLLVSFQQLSDDWHKDYQLSNRADGIILLGYGDSFTSMPRLRSLGREGGTDFVIWGPIVTGIPWTLHLQRQQRGQRSLPCVTCSSSGGAALPTSAARRTGQPGRSSSCGTRAMKRRCAAQESSPTPGCGSKRSRTKPRATIPPCGSSTRVRLSTPFSPPATGSRSASSVRCVTAVSPCLATFPSWASTTSGPLRTSTRRSRPVQGQDTQHAGEMLVENLLQLIPGASVDSVLIEPRLVVRTSCGSRDPLR